MTLALHAFRSRQRALARWVLALFCLVWLQAAIVPCAMAVVPEGLGGVAEEHCSYCPPEHGTDRHGAPDGTVRCAYPDHPQADNRPDARANAPSLLALAVPVLVMSLEQASGQPGTAFDRARLPDRGGPSLAIAYCRQLK